MGYKEASHLSIQEYLTDRIVLNPETGCWVWKLRPESKGYGQVWHRDYYGQMAHRVSYQTIGNKTIGEFLTLDHLCWNKLCINPEHLEEVTAEENVKRWAQRDLCRKEHKLTEDNIYTWAGVRRCKKCYQSYLCGKKL